MALILLLCACFLCALVLGHGDHCGTGVDQTNKKTIEGIYQSLGRGDIKSILQQLDDETHFLIGQPYQTGIAPWLRSYHGKEEVGKFFELMSKDLDIKKFAGRDWVVSEDGNIVSVVVDIKYEHKVTKKSLEFELSHRFMFRNKKIVKATSYFDTLGIDQLYKPLTKQDMRNVATTIVEAMNRHDLETAGKVFTDDVKIHNFGPTPLNKAGWKKMISELITAFPDARFEIDDLVADEETGKLGFRHHLVGTHKGNYMGVAPTNKRVTVSATAVYKIIATAPTSFAIPEWWIDVDMFGLMIQLGAIPPPPQIA